MLDILEKSASALQLVGRIVGGLYHAGKNLPKYELFQVLFKTSRDGQPDNNPHSAFLDFLIKAKILLNTEDYQKLVVDNIEYVYTAFHAQERVGNATLNEKKSETLKKEEFSHILTAVDRRYAEFSDTYEKIHSKGYSTNAATVERELEKAKKSDQPSAIASTSQSVSLDIYRREVAALLEPKGKAKKDRTDENDLDKEINIEEAAKTSKLDVQPFHIRINQKTITITPREVFQHPVLTDKIRRNCEAATQKISSKPPMQEEEAKKIDAGIKQFVKLREKHENKKFIQESIAKVPPFSVQTIPSPFDKLSAAQAADVLAIIAIASENDNSNPMIRKGMNISRIAAIGQVNRCFHKPPDPPQPSGLTALSSIERIRSLINEKLGEESNEAKALIKTLETMQALNKSIDIRTLLDMYMTNVLYRRDDKNDKQPIESILELCEADATAVEYIHQTEETLRQITPYLQTEASRLGATHTLNRSIESLTGNSSPGKEEAKTMKERDAYIDSSSDDDDEIEHVVAEKPLNEFSNTLAARVEMKKQAEAATGAKKIVKNIIKGKNTQARKTANTEDCLNEAIELIEESLIYVMEAGPHRHKTESSEEGYKNILSAIELKQKQLEGMKREFNEKMMELHQINLQQMEELNNINPVVVENYNQPTKTPINMNDSKKVEIDKSIRALEESIHQAETTINTLESERDAYEELELLENPTVIVHRICDKLNDARVEHETSDQLKTQTAIFNHFYNALKSTLPEGRKLAEDMKSYVENHINVKNDDARAIVIGDSPTPSQKSIITKVSSVINPGSGSNTTVSTDTKSELIKELRIAYQIKKSTNSDKVKNIETSFQKLCGYSIDSEKATSEKITEEEVEAYKREHPKVTFGKDNTEQLLLRVKVYLKQQDTQHQWPKPK